MKIKVDKGLGFELDAKPGEIQIRQETHRDEDDVIVLNISEAQQLLDALPHALTIAKGTEDYLGHED